MNRTSHLTVTDACELGPGTAIVESTRQMPMPSMPHGHGGETMTPREMACVDV
jgi:hypothetical protein